MSTVIEITTGLVWRKSGTDEEITSWPVTHTVPGYIYTDAVAGGAILELIEVEFTISADDYSGPPTVMLEFPNSGDQHVESFSEESLKFLANGFGTPGTIGNITLLVEDTGGATSFTINETPMVWVTVIDEVDPPDESDCFWTNKIGVTEDCDIPPPFEFFVNVINWNYIPTGNEPIGFVPSAPFYVDFIDDLGDPYNIGFTWNFDDERYEADSFPAVTTFQNFEGVATQGGNNWPCTIAFAAS